MEDFIIKLHSINNPQILFIICGVVIFTDITTGYLKAIKNKNINSSISRDGFLKKIGWIISLLFGFAIDILVGVNIFLIGSAMVCVATETISVYENLGELGVKLPFAKYFKNIDGGK